MPVPLSVLDLAPVPSGSTPAEALRRTVALARLADRLGFVRLWYAEHHSMPGIASSVPEILIAHAAAATERIRVGSGGIMMQNHVPLKLAEAFRTLAALHPGRIDLGIGRAPGTDPMASRALRAFEPDAFSGQMAELRAFTSEGFPEAHPLRRVQAVPTGVPLPPVWLLGSSGASARYAGESGLGYAFASHFSPAPAAPAFGAYREAFLPSDAFPTPHAILAVSVVCAPTLDRAAHLATTHDLMWVRLQRGEIGPLPSPEEALAYPYTPEERASVQARRGLVLVGTPEQVRARIEAMAAEAGADEVMVTMLVHDAEERLRAHALLAEAFAMGMEAPRN